MPELLWKAYIDFEIEEGERERARALYDRLVGLSGHIKAWISYAQFEAEPIPVPRAVRDEEEEAEEEGEGAEEKEPRYQSGDPAIARQVFERGHDDLKRQGLKHEVRMFLSLTPVSRRSSPCVQRFALLQVWKAFEENNGTSDDVARVERMMPVVGRRRNADQTLDHEAEGAVSSFLYPRKGS